MLPAACLNVDFFPWQPDNAYQQALSQPVLAHYTRRLRAAVRSQRELTVTLHPDQAVALHARNRLTHRRASLRKALGDPRTQRDNTFLFEFEDRSKVHLGRVDQAVRSHKRLPPP